MLYPSVARAALLYLCVPEVASLLRTEQVVSNASSVGFPSTPARAEALRAAGSLVEKMPIARQQKLSRMVKKMLWSPITASAVPLQPDASGKARTFVQAGDFPYLWLRDSTASLHHLFATGLIDKHPELQERAAGLARVLSTYVKLNPMCCVWKPPLDSSTLKAEDCWDQKSELDSPMYFLRFIRHLREHNMSVAYESHIQEAVLAVIKHVESQMGPQGLVRSVNRPSDDKALSNSYHVPDNFFVVAELQKLSEPAILGMWPLWSTEQQTRVRLIAEKISAALTKYATKNLPDMGGAVYCYEVIPNFKCNLMDDANIPSLLALPYFADGVFDPDVYERSRKWILSAKNKEYHSNHDATVRGLGSPHTPGARVWPMGLLAQGLSSTDPREIVDVLSMLMDTDAGSDLMHESFQVSVSKGNSFSRSWFDWPNALFVEFVHACCSEVVQKIAPDTYHMPGTSFEGWSTCGFHNGICTRPAALARQKGKSCVRYGSTFSGFVHRLVELPVNCDATLGKARLPAGYTGYFPPPLHCAVGPNSACSALSNLPVRVNQTRIPTRMTGSQIRKTAINQSNKRVPTTPSHTTSRMTVDFLRRRAEERHKRTSTVSMRRR